MKKTIDFLEKCKPAKKQFFQNLAVFPLICPERFKPFYLTLEEALGDGRIQLLELDEQGTVSDVRLVNHGEKPVLIIEGEAIVGAKQNRIMNATFLIAGTSKVVIPVSCVEQGRWRRDTHEFYHSRKIMNPSLRRETKSSVNLSLKRGEGYRSNQRRVWNDIAEKSQQLGVNSPTMALTDVFEIYEDRLKDYKDHFFCVENQQKSPSRNVPDLDLGFKVFKLDSSNIKPWDADFDNLEDSLFNAVENIKPDRNDAGGLQGFGIQRRRGQDKCRPDSAPGRH